MKKQMLFGIIIVIIGLNLLFNAINLSIGNFIAPLIFFILGLYFYKRKHTFISLLFFIISVSIFFDHLLGVNFISLLIAVVALYYGIRLVRAPSSIEKRRNRRRKEKREEHKEEVVDEVVSVKGEEQVVYTPTMRRSFIGDIHYMGESYELNDLTIWNGIGDVRIDLSKAIIPEGETVVIVQCMIGQIDFFVPEDLAVTIQASTIVGEIYLFHEKHEGINQQLSIATRHYKQSPRRVKLVLSTVIGEVKVRAV
ncbi:cell wall-active antibiotics response protein LiaF [Halalkalibacter krulwichiae]|uniref:Cell wall-active antibiotics response LiaF-like C-terminal domain-containing protein n=1 Tax=Halalkalibacter krulwichiae TaxID=199441 RepID=A0A1X9MC90_9BACI|nr:cell wall-active antibiotics response protein LiaF [Halalkalibacter krulwichiae]ARK29181.1 hypothetical protein BkAM31D_04525 [Halalkalibacter krulwichiae]